MSRVMLASVLASALGLAATVSGCANGNKTDHAMASQTAGHEMKCQKCYDFVTTVRHELRGGPWTANQVVRKHMCDDCKSETTVYTKDGKLMVKCDKCAPGGVPCDKCLPPKAHK